MKKIVGLAISSLVMGLFCKAGEILFSKVTDKIATIYVESKIKKINENC